MKDAFPIREVIQITSVQRETFKTWVSRGYIKPSVYQAAGPGEQSLYNRGDLYNIKLFQHLLDRGSGFPRNTASLMIKGFLKTVKAQGTKHSDIAFVAFFKRPFNQDIMTNKTGPYFTKDHQLKSGKALAPGVRILSSADVKKSFESLFLTFDDTDISEEFDLNMIDIEFISITNFKRIKARVDTAIKKLNFD